MLNLAVVVVTFLVSACDNLGHSLSFPAQVSGIAGFDDSSLVTERVDKLLDTAGNKFLVYSESGSTGSTIKFALVDDIPKQSETAAHVDFTTVIMPSISEIGARGVAGQTRVAGRATRYGSECLVEISRFVLEYGDELLQPVLWHEIGHCAGLPHDSTANEVMSAITYPLGHYDQEKIDRFIKQLLAAINS